MFGVDTTNGLTVLLNEMKPELCLCELLGCLAGNITDLSLRYRLKFCHYSAYMQEFVIATDTYSGWKLLSFSRYHLNVTCRYSHPDRSSPYPQPTSRRCILILSYHLRLGLTRSLLPSGLSTKIVYDSLHFPIRATCPIHLILLDLISRILFGEEYRA